MSKICELFHHKGIKKNPRFFLNECFRRQTNKIMGSAIKATVERLVSEN